jgi:hypothetical protein
LVIPWQIIPLIGYTIIVEEHNCEVAEKKLKFNTEQYITKPSSANVHEPEAPVRY